jgi:hypothetical protein
MYQRRLSDGKILREEKRPKQSKAKPDGILKKVWKNHNKETNHKMYNQIIKNDRSINNAQRVLHEMYQNKE